MVHLTAFRFGIAGCAVVSGLVLNGLTAWWLLRLVSRNNPPLYRAYRMWAIGGSILIVLVRDPRHLPDALSVIVATVMILLPFAISLAARRWFGIGGIIPVEEPAGKERSPRRSGGSLRSRI